MRTWMLGLTAALAVNSIAVPRLFQAGQAATTVAIAERAPAPWLQADPADSLYRVAREALNRNQYRKAAVADLAEHYRLVFLLHDVEGYTHEEIAGLLGVETGTSKARLSRARARLREALAAFA